MMLPPDGLLYMMTDIHREAVRQRKLWRRIWFMLFYSIFALVCGAVYSLAQAQTAPVPAYEESVLAWDYPTDAANHAGFKLTISNVAGSTTFGKAVRQVPLANTVLKGKPFGQYTLNLVATGVAPAKDSAPAVMSVNYQATPVLASPTSIKIILEWNAK